jgi:hypothetical protein
MLTSAASGQRSRIRPLKSRLMRPNRSEPGWLIANARSSNLWVTGPGGIRVLSLGGEYLGVMLGCEGLHSLFVMTSTSAHVITTTVGPAPVPPG